jgi:glycosyltransferase involved in cell wall biosynthesis
VNEAGELTLLHIQTPAIGYGRLGVELHKALDDRGVDVYNGIEFPDHIRAKMSQGDLDVADGRNIKRTNVVGWVSVPTHARGWYEGQWPFVFTMWEATWLPESFRESLHNFPMIVVPSTHNVELFSEFHDNVRYCPLGIDPVKWHFTERRQGPTFDVLVGGSGARKGLDVAVTAFAKAFPEGSWGDGPVPRLILKSPKANLGYPDEIRNALPFPPSDRLTVISGRLPPEDEVALYQTAHVYLQPSRGEGFGLQPLQAIAQGLPTILTDAHGHEAFSHLGWPVGHSLVKSGYFIYGDHPDMMWWEPDVDDIVDHLRSIYDDYEGACAVAARASKEARAEFTWDRTAGHFLDALDGNHLREPDVSGDWFIPPLKLYHIRVNRPWAADIAGVHYRFDIEDEDGNPKDYYGPSDVKRILFEGGILHPACLTSSEIGSQDDFDNNGLTADQAEKIGAYSASASFCRACQQQINTVPTKADLLWALSQARNGVDDQTILEGLTLPPAVEVMTAAKLKAETMKLKDILAGA